MNNSVNGLIDWTCFWRLVIKIVLSPTIVFSSPSFHSK